MNLATCVENRKKNIEKMNNAGMSVYDIARFYQMPPRIVQEYIEDFLKVPYNNDPKDEFSEILYRAFSEKRDKSYAKAAAEGSDALEVYKEKVGLVIFSPSKGVVEDIITEYKKLRNVDETHKIGGVDKKKINAINENELFCELYASNWNRQNILDYADIEGSQYNYLTKIAKMIGYNNHGDDSLAKEMIKEGFKTRDIALVTSVHESYIQQYKKDPEIIEEKNRRADERQSNVIQAIHKIHDGYAEQCYRLYIEEGMTQAEIGKQLFGNENARVRVSQYIKTYFATHPEAAIKEKITNRGRRRNNAEHKRISIKEDEKRILEFVKDHPDMAMWRIIENLAKEGIGQYIVYRTLEREGLYTKRFFTKDEFDFNKRFLELKAKFSGMSTSEIMAFVKEDSKEKYINNPDVFKYRYSILNDIEKEVNFIIANPDIQDRIIERACALSREEMLGPKFYKIALEEMSVKMDDTQKGYIERLGAVLDKLIEDNNKNLTVKTEFVEFKYETKKVNLSRDEAEALLNNTKYRLHYIEDSHKFMEVKYNNKEYTELLDGNSPTIGRVKSSVQKANKFMHEALGFERGLIKPTVGDEIGFAVREYTGEDVSATKLSKVDWEAKGISSVDELIDKIQSGEFLEQEDFTIKMNKCLSDLSESYQKNDDFERE